VCYIVLFITRDCVVCIVDRLLEFFRFPARSSDFSLSIEYTRNSTHARHATEKIPLNVKNSSLLLCCHLQRLFETESGEGKTMLEQKRAF
jgi:hypothetical protein